MKIYFRQSLKPFLILGSESNAGLHIIFSVASLELSRIYTNFCDRSVMETTISRTWLQSWKLRDPLTTYMNKRMFVDSRQLLLSLTKRFCLFNIFRRKNEKNQRFCWRQQQCAVKSISRCCEIDKTSTKWVYYTRIPQTSGLFTRTHTLFVGPTL